MRLVLIVDDLLGGGAGRAASTLCNTWAEKGWSIWMLTSDDGSVPPAYKLHPKIINLPLALYTNSTSAVNGLLNNVRRVRAVRKALRHSMPDLIISFLDRWNIITLAASIGLGVPVLVQEHCDPNERALGGTWELLRYLLYPRASFVVTLTPTAMRFFSLRPKIRGRVIPNPVVVPPNEYVHPSSNIIGKDYRKIVSLGRLHEVKSFDKLLSAFAFIANKHPDWSLEIWGDGPERPQLTSLIVEMNLEGRVSLPGVTRNPFACLTGADLFVMTSKTEGFPMALCEAMACGVPVISFDCPSGPRHIVRDGVDGVLVPPGDINALAIAMDRLMSDEAERCRLANRAPDVLERFSLEKVVGMWEELIRQADEYR